MLSDALARSKRNTAVCRAMIRAANAFNDFRFRGTGDMGRTQELAKFERQEIEFRKKDREDRAAGLRIHLRDNSHDLLFQRPRRS
jgi:hypothetical protein